MTGGYIKKIELSRSGYISPVRRGETPSAIILHSSTTARNMGTSVRSRHPGAHYLGTSMKPRHPKAHNMGTSVKSRHPATWFCLFSFISVYSGLLCIWLDVTHVTTLCMWVVLSAKSPMSYSCLSLLDIYCWPGYTFKTCIWSYLSFGLLILVVIKVVFM